MGKKTQSKFKCTNCMSQSSCTASLHISCRTKWYIWYAKPVQNVNPLNDLVEYYTKSPKRCSSLGCIWSFNDQGMHSKLYNNIKHKSEAIQSKLHERGVGEGRRQRKRSYLFHQQLYTPFMSETAHYTNLAVNKHLVTIKGKGGQWLAHCSSFKFYSWNGNKEYPSKIHISHSGNNWNT